jgi:hypothetical protein
MANAWYGLGVQHFVAGDVAWASNTIKVALVSAGYTRNLTTDEFFSVAVSGGNIVSAGVTLTSKTNALGKVSAANTTWTSVSGSQITQLVGYVGGTAGSGDFLLFNLDTGTNLPVTPNGGNITSSWDPTNGIGTLMTGLSERDKISLGQQFWDWVRDVLAVPARRDPQSGLWLPTLGEPTLTLD